MSDSLPWISLFLRTTRCRSSQQGESWEFPRDNKPADIAERKEQRALTLSITSEHKTAIKAQQEPRELEKWPQFGSSRSLSASSAEHHFHMWSFLLQQTRRIPIPFLSLHCDKNAFVKKIDKSRSQSCRHQLFFRKRWRDRNLGSMNNYNNSINRFEIQFGTKVWRLKYQIQRFRDDTIWRYAIGWSYCNGLTTFKKSVVVFLRVINCVSN